MFKRVILDGRELCFCKLWVSGHMKMTYLTKTIVSTYFDYCFVAHNIYADLLLRDKLDPVSTYGNNYN